MSFEEAYNEFLIYASKRHKKQSFDTIHRNFNIHILPFFKDIELRNLNMSNILEWQNDILTKNFSNNFNNSLFYYLKAFLNYCVMCSYISSNPVDLVNRFKKKIEPKKYDIYNIHEFRNFRRGIKNSIYKQFFNFMFFYGTRPSEAIALRFCDLNGLYVNINHSIHRRGKRLLDTPKNQSSVRTFKISYLMLFRIYLLKKQYIKKYGNYCNEYYIFGGKKPLSTTSIDRYKHKACVKQNIREITQHQFRHSYATRMIHNKVAIDLVSSSMGHSRVSTTLDIYLHNEKRSITTTPFSKLF